MTGSCQRHTEIIVSLIKIGFNFYRFNKKLGRPLQLIFAQLNPAKGIMHIGRTWFHA